MWFLFCLLASARSARPLLKVTLKCRPDHTRGPSKTSRPKCFARNSGQRARQLFLRQEKAPIAYTFRTREKHAKEEGAYYSCKEPPVRLTGTHKPASWHTLWPGEVRSQQLVRWGGHAVRRPRRAYAIWQQHHIHTGPRPISKTAPTAARWCGRSYSGMRSLVPALSIMAKDWRQ